MTHSASALLDRIGPVLCLDIGSGTQDVLLALPGLEPENWPRLVLPAPARAVAGRIAAATAARRPVWLHGTNMGGGFARAVMQHIEAGLSVAAHPAAAMALHDDPARVTAMSVSITERPPSGSVPVMLADYEPGYWRALAAVAGLPAPALVVAAAQDHGVHPVEGNRIGRFGMWRSFVTQEGGDPARLVHDTPPQPCTRLAALQDAIGGGPVADTGAAAVLGALSMPEVAARSHREGITVVNVGNSHIIAFLVFRERVVGIYEHHTGMHDRESLLHDLHEFRMCWLPDEQVRAAGGHGCIFAPDIAPESEGFRPTFVIGPRRNLLQGHGQFIAPYGDMMLAGCHGLLHGLAARETTA